MSKCENNWSGNVTTIVLLLAYEYTINNSFGKSSKNMRRVRIGGFFQEAGWARVPQSAIKPG